MEEQRPQAPSGAHAHIASADAAGKGSMPVPEGQPSTRSVATGGEGASAPRSGSRAGEATEPAQGNGGSEGANNGSEPTPPAASSRWQRPHLFHRSAGASGGGATVAASGASKSGASKSGASTSSGSGFHLPSLGSLGSLRSSRSTGGQQGGQQRVPEHELRPYPLKPSMYELHEKIGIGSSATVWRATCTLYDEQVAVKIINLEVLDVDLSVFSREAGTMALLRHPCVVPLFCAFIEGDSLWMVQPFVQGGSLSDLLQGPTFNGEGLDEPTLAAVARRCLQGLEYIHTQGYVHRDVKAANLLVGGDGHVAIADFTIATQLERRFEAGDAVSVERAQGFAGTLITMAPEIIEGLGADAKADIWSLGMTLVEMAWGHHPWLSRPVNAVMIAILAAGEDEGGQRYGGLPGLPPTRAWSNDAHNFLSACLRREPGDRPSARKLLRHHWLKHVKDDAWLAGRLVPALPPPGERRQAKQCQVHDFAGRRGFRRQLKDMGSDLAAQAQGVLNMVTHHHAAPAAAAAAAAAAGGAAQADKGEDDLEVARVASSDSAFSDKRAPSVASSRRQSSTAAEASSHACLGGAQERVNALVDAHGSLSLDEPPHAGGGGAAREARQLQQAGGGTKFDWDFSAVAAKCPPEVDFNAPA